MAYTKSHNLEYKDCAGIDTKIEFLEDGFAGSVTECETTETPLEVDIAPMDPTIFIPVIGKGATIQLNSVTEGQYRSLYSKDPVKRMVKIYKNNNATPWWLGYINAEQYGEQYSRLTDYPVVINCNDGFNILKRYKYLNGTGMYTTLETFWNILTRIIGKTGLPYQYIYLATNLSITGITVDEDKTIFHYLKANQENYYDEKDEPKTYRAVLECIMTSFGLQIRQENGSIFIYEPQMLAAASFSAKRFNGTTYAYVDTVSVNNNFDISAEEINWDNEDQVYDTKSGYNRQKIRFSAYPREGAIPEINIADKKRWSIVTETWTADEYGIYRLQPAGRTIDGMTFETSELVLTGHRQGLDSSNQEIYLERQTYNYSTLLLTIPGFNIAPVSGTFLAISGEIYIRTKHDEFGMEEASADTAKIVLPIALEIAGYRYVYSGGVWSWVYGTTVLPLGAYIYRSGPYENVSDKWLPFTIYVENTGMPAGMAQLKVWHPTIYNGADEELNFTGDILNVRLKNFSCKCYKSESTPQNMIESGSEDPKYDGKLDDAFENEAPEITVEHADAVSHIDRGGITKTDGTATTGWRKPGDTTDHKLVHHLLRAIASQYQDSLDVLRGTIEADALYGDNGGPCFLHTIQDSDFLGSVKMMFAGGKYNDFDRTLNGEWVAVKSEDLTINLV